MSPNPGTVEAEATRVHGQFLRDVMKLNAERRNFRVFGPDETASNRLDAVFEVTDRTWMAEIDADDDHCRHDGRVMEMLSEHMCQGWLEGYLLTGRHGFFSCYEAFIHIVDSMFNQHAKWLKSTRDIPWRRPIASLNYLLTSHVWRQDHNGFSHQDPGFIDHVVNKKADVVRVYLPPDANTLAVRRRPLPAEPRITSTSSSPASSRQPQWLDMDAAITHCTAGIGIWEWASNDDGGEPDVVMACAATCRRSKRSRPSTAAAARARAEDPRRQRRRSDDAAASDRASARLDRSEFDSLFTSDKPIIFAFHGYPWLIHRLTYRRTNHDNLHVRGYKEEGTTTTPFDMTVLNESGSLPPGRRCDRALVRAGIGGSFQAFRDKLVEHKTTSSSTETTCPRFATGSGGGRRTRGFSSRLASIQARGPALSAIPTRAIRPQLPVGIRARPRRGKASP